MRLIAQMIVRNEEGRNLEKVLTDLERYVDKIIVLDDASTDNTRDICKQFNKVELHVNKESLFNINESELRNQLWEITRLHKPEWVLSIDADEMFDETLKERLPNILDSDYDWMMNRLCDMWNEDEYRVDGYWSPLLLRLYRFKDLPFGKIGAIHCGCVPAYVTESKNGVCHADIKLKHLSYIKDEDKERKYNFYVVRTRGFNLAHALSIKQPATLKKWEDKKEFERILVGMLVRDRAWSLPKVLEGLALQDYPKNKISFMFLVNDCKDDSFEILKQWKRQWEKEYEKIDIVELNFGVSNKDHSFPDVTIRNIANMRNQVLNSIGDRDYVFLIDSDIYLQKNQTLKHLVCLDKDVVSEVFWAVWGQDNGKELPNVWERGGYELSQKFADMIKNNKGVYRVGGLGACTLISKKTITSGINYDRVYNLPTDMRGEDRDFCIRASVKGINLWADTWMTPIHMERDKSIQVVEKKRVVVTEKLPISVSMIVKNEQEYLEKCLESVKDWVEEIVIVDTGSSDKTKEIAKRYTDKVFNYPWDGNFANARNFAKEKCISKWILRIDADEEIPEDSFITIKDYIKDDSVYGIIFPIVNYQQDPKFYDKPMWVLSETVRMFKNIPEIYFDGFVHEEITSSVEKLALEKEVPMIKSTVAIYHYGYLREKDKLNKKFNYYAELAEKQIKENSRDCRPYFNLAVHHYHCGNLDKAEKYYKKVLSLNPNHFMSLHDMGVIVYKRAFQMIKPNLKIAQDYFKKAHDNTGKTTSNVFKEKIVANLKQITDLLNK